MKKIKKILLFCLICALLVGCSSDAKERSSKKKDKKIKEKNDEIVYCIESECAVGKDGNIIYKIEYFYDNKGNETKRVAYDSNGENEYWLSFAYDVVGWEENLYREPDELDQGRWFSLDMNYELIYDKAGCLKKAISCGENDIEYIEYAYKEIEIPKIDKEEENVVDAELSNSEQDNEENNNQMSLEEKIYNYDGVINVNGEMCYAIWGESEALVWKYVDATFEDDAHFLYAMVKDISDVETNEPGAESWDAYRYTQWRALYGTDNFGFWHVGDDIFSMNFTYSCYDDYRRGWRERERYVYINGKEQTLFFDYKVLPDEMDYFDRITEFNDGYAICQYNKYRTELDSTYIAVMDKFGNLTMSELTVPDYINTVDEVQCGCYSDGLFYYDYAFYDIEFNKIVDLSGKNMGRPYVNQGLYTPQYVDGICTMVTEKNGLYWIFDIDINGDIISEVEEFDIWSLNI